MRALVSSLLETRAQPPGGHTGEIPPAPAPEPDADGAEDAQGAELQDLAERFARDAVDTRWALESIDRIERSIADVELDGVYVTHLDCRSSLCLLELEVDPHVPTEPATRQLVDGLAWEGAGRLQLDDGHALLYLERGPSTQ